MTSIHPTAIVSPRAALAPDVSIGPYAVIDDDVTIGAGCRVAAHAVIRQGTVIGAYNQICEGAVLGGLPQHLQAGEQVGGLRIGDGNTIREYVTIHRALYEGEYTTVGQHNLIMVNAHVAHDCRVGDRTIIANNVVMAGHVVIGDAAYLSGAVAIHQFCRIGKHAMVGGQAHIKQDVPPYVTIDGRSSQIVGLNLIGLRRRGFSDADVYQLKAAYRVIYRSGMRWSEVLAALREQFPTGPAAEFHLFFAGGTRGFAQERRPPPAATIRVLRQEEDRRASEQNRKVG